MSLSLVLRCYDYTSLDLDQFDSGDKLTLPSSVLIQITARGIDLPLCFRATAMNDPLYGGMEGWSGVEGVHKTTQEKDDMVINTDAMRTSVCCGVREFTSPDDTVYMPSWAMVCA